MRRPPTSTNALPLVAPPAILLTHPCQCTAANFHGSGSLQVTSGTVYGEQFRSLTSGVRFTGQQVQLLNATLTENGGRISGSGTYNMADASLSFDSRGENIDLSHLRFLQG